MDTKTVFKALEEALNEIKLLKLELADLRADNADLKTEVSLLKEEIKRLRGEDPDPNTPSGMTPTFKKENSKGRKLKPGRKDGHEGSRRESPQEIDKRVEHDMNQCPDCGCPLCKPVAKRIRIIEEIPFTRPEVTEHTINRYYCRNCKKLVEPIITDALPHSQMGLRFLIITAWLRYGLGMTTGNIMKWLAGISGMKITAGGLSQMWQRLAERFTPIYDEIGYDIRGSSVVHADETGWRVSGITHWLWCFTTSKAAYYVINPGRNSNVVLSVLGEVFRGTLVSDFFAAYNKIEAWSKQKCLVHMFRELKTTSSKNRGAEWKLFAKKFKRLLKDAIRLMENRSALATNDYERLTTKIYERYNSIICETYFDKDTTRLIKRLKRHRHEMFVFLEETNVPFENNHAERQIRPMVIMRKNSYCNRSEAGARTQAILMSVFRTLSLKNISQIDYAVEYLKNSLNNNFQRSNKLAA
jgi:transposase